MNTPEVLSEVSKFLLISSATAIVTVAARLNPTFLPIYWTIQGISAVAVAFATYKNLGDDPLIIKAAIVLGCFIGYYDLITVMINYVPETLVKYIIGALAGLTVTLILKFIGDKESNKKVSYFDNDEVDY